MLIVKAVVKESEIHGKGLFAVDFIPEGTVVWKFDPDVDRIQATQEDHFSWRTEDGYVTPGDDAKYINHSYCPNLRTTPGLSPAVAARDIQPGEEITESYEYDLDWSSYSSILAK